MEATKIKRRSAKRVLTKPRKVAEFDDPDTAPLDFLPPEVINILKNKKYRFSQNEQIMLTLVTQILVEILIEEEL